MTHFNSLVTGGAQGIGFAIVKKLLSRGDKLFVFDCLEESHQSVDELRQLGVTYIQTDIASIDSIKLSFEALFSMLSDKKLDILVNNAGITKDNLALRMNEKDWDSVIDINLKGTFFCSQQALKRMVRQSKSYIINISSIVALHGNPGQANYAASKAGIMALTQTLAQEYASRNILVNAIAPGFIQTKMTDKLSEEAKNMALQRIALKRFGDPDDIANLVDFLSSGNADYITGQVIQVTGGML